MKLFLGALLAGLALATPYTTTCFTYLYSTANGRNPCEADSFLENWSYMTTYTVDSQSSICKNVTLTKRAGLLPADAFLLNTTSNTENLDNHIFRVQMGPADSDGFRGARFRAFLDNNTCTSFVPLNPASRRLQQFGGGGFGGGGFGGGGNPIMKSYLPEFASGCGPWSVYDIKTAGHDDAFYRTLCYPGVRPDIAPLDTININVVLSLSSSTPSDLLTTLYKFYTPIQNLLDASSACSQGDQGCFQVTASFGSDFIQPKDYTFGPSAISTKTTGAATIEVTLTFAYGWFGDRHVMSAKTFNTLAALRTTGAFSNNSVLQWGNWTVNSTDVDIFNTYAPSFARAYTAGSLFKEDDSATAAPPAPTCAIAKFNSVSDCQTGLSAAQYFVPFAPVDFNANAQTGCQLTRVRNLAGTFNPNSDLSASLIKDGYAYVAQRNVTGNVHAVQFYASLRECMQEGALLYGENADGSPSAATFNASCPATSSSSNSSAPFFTIVCGASAIPKESTESGMLTATYPVQGLTQLVASQKMDALKQAASDAILDGLGPELGIRATYGFTVSSSASSVAATFTYNAGNVAPILQRMRTAIKMNEVAITGLLSTYMSTASGLKVTVNNSVVASDANIDSYKTTCFTFAYPSKYGRTPCQRDSTDENWAYMTRTVVTPDTNECQDITFTKRPGLADTDAVLTVNGVEKLSYVVKTSMGPADSSGYRSARLKFFPDDATCEKFNGRNSAVPQAGPACPAIGNPLPCYYNEQDKRGCSAIALYGLDGNAFDTSLFARITCYPGELTELPPMERVDITVVFNMSSAVPADFLGANYTVYQPTNRVLQASVVCREQGGCFDLSASYSASSVDPRPYSYGPTVVSNRTLDKNTTEVTAVISFGWHGDRSVLSFLADNTVQALIGSASVFQNNTIANWGTWNSTVDVLSTYNPVFSRAYASGTIYTEDDPAPAPIAPTCALASFANATACNAGLASADFYLPFAAVDYNLTTGAGCQRVQARELVAGTLSDAGIPDGFIGFFATRKLSDSQYALSTYASMRECEENAPLLYAVNADGTPDVTSVGTVCGNTSDGRAFAIKCGAIPQVKLETAVVTMAFAFTEGVTKAYVEANKQAFTAQLTDALISSLGSRLGNPGTYTITWTFVYAPVTATSSTARRLLATAPVTANAAITYSAEGALANAQRIQTSVQDNESTIAATFSSEVSSATSLNVQTSIASVTAAAAPPKKSAAVGLSSSIFATVVLLASLLFF